MFDQINIELKPSFFVAALINIPFVSASLLVGSRDTSLFIIALLLLTFLWVNLYYVSLLSALRLKASITHIRLSDKQLTLVDNSKQSFYVELSNHSLVTPWFCILIFTLNASKKEKIVLLCKQNINNSDEFRRFRVWTKFGNSLPQKPSVI